MKITLVLAFIFSILSLNTNCMGEPYLTGKTSDKPLRLPEDVPNMNRFLHQMTLRTILMSDVKFDEMVESNTDNPDFRNALKTGMFFYTNTLQYSKDKIVKLLTDEDAPKNEFDARRKASVETDYDSLVSPVSGIDYISVDITNLIKNSKYDFDKEGFRIVKEIEERRLMTTSMYEHLLPHWIDGGHIFDSLIKIKPALAEKWREANGALRCVYLYTGSGPEQFGVYPLHGKPIRYEFLDQSSSVIASVPAADVSHILEGKSVEYWEKKEEQKKPSSLPFMLGCICILLVCFFIFIIRYAYIIRKH